MPSEVGGVELSLFVVVGLLCVDADVKLPEVRLLQIVCTLGRERSSDLTMTVGLDMMGLRSFDESTLR